VIVYSPAEAEVVLRVNPVAVDTTVIVAPGTTALLESVTTPVISPVSACPKINKGNRNTTQISEIARKVLLDIGHCPFDLHH
jgi:hypothetical protein